MADILVIFEDGIDVIRKGLFLWIHDGVDDSVSQMSYGALHFAIDFDQIFL